MNKLTFDELNEILKNDHSKNGVIVFKQNANWTEEYSEEERSYIVSGSCKYFNPAMLGSSIFGTNLTNTDRGVRLDWYMHQDEYPWEVDYCYLYDKDI